MTVQTNKKPLPARLAAAACWLAGCQAAARAEGRMDSS